MVMVTTRSSSHYNCPPNTPATFISNPIPNVLPDVESQQLASILSKMQFIIDGLTARVAALEVQYGLQPINPLLSSSPCPQSKVETPPPPSRLHNNSNPKQTINPQKNSSLQQQHGPFPVQQPPAKTATFIQQNNNHPQNPILRQQQRLFPALTNPFEVQCQLGMTTKQQALHNKHVLILAASGSTLNFSFDFLTP